MTRKAYQLSDDQARVLVKLMPEILERYPAGARHLGDFTYDLIDAVYQATGRTFSPAIYQRWLPTYAPGRMPSTDTLASAKRKYDAELRKAPAVATGTGAEPSENIAAIITRAVNEAFCKAGQHIAGNAAERRAQAQIEQLQVQLLAAEQRTNEARAQAARLAGDLQASRAACERLQVEIDAGRTAADQLAKGVADLANELADVRKFSMHAVDGVRGETRAWQERCKALEDQLKRKTMELEVFRRLAYRAGAAIPSVIAEGGSE